MLPENVSFRSFDSKRNKLYAPKMHPFPDSTVLLSWMVGQESVNVGITAVVISLMNLQWLGKVQCLNVKNSSK